MKLFSPANRPSVAVRVASTEITVIKLNSQTKHLGNLYQQPLPKGTFIRGHVKNPKALETATAQAVVASKISGSEVTIGFPENKTFTTTLAISDIPLADLDAAVGWQAEEILPQPADKVYYDWRKINPSGPDKTATKINQLLFVATPKILVDPIINSLIKAGIKPVSCEPTSLSLSRLAPKGELSLVAEIRKTDSTVILVDKLLTPILSTVIPDPASFTSEVNKLVNFYFNKNKLKPSTIYICGQGITPDWQKYLSNQTKLKVAPLKLPEISNPPANLLSFAVSISLAIKPPVLPKDPQTINLLPKNLAATYQKAVEKTALSLGFKLIVTSLILTAISMFSGFVYLKVAAQKLTEQIALRESAAGQAQYSKLAKQAEAANTQSRILNRLPPQDGLGTVLSDLQAALLDGITLDSYILDLTQKALLINGLALTRDDLLKFKTNLETKDSFKLVTIPLPTLERKQNLRFSIAVDLGGAK